MTERIAKVIDVWVAWTNTDLTEGRGREIPFAVCKSRTTAKRLGHNQSVQGSNCRVTKEIAVELEGNTSHLYAPTRVHEPTEQDKARDEFRSKQDAAFEKAKELGMTAEELEYLRVNKGGDDAN